MYIYMTSDTKQLFTIPVNNGHFGNLIWRYLLYIYILYIYPLVISQFAIENGYIHSGFQNGGSFHRYVNVYQKVYL